MRFKKPINENYCATIVEIKSIIPLEGCDNIQSTIIFGNSIIIGKDTNVGDIGIYFPAETQLSDEFARMNNLYRHTEKNNDPEKKGYIEDNRRIRTMKMRGNKSCGLFMPLESLTHFIDINMLEIGDAFDELKGTPICNKYIVEKKKSQGPNKQKKKEKKESKLIDGQFRFHDDTSQFGKNIHKFKPDDIIGISYKMHGTSGVISKVICKKSINWFYKLLRLLGIKVVDTEYANIYSSRRIVKNDDMNKPQDHFYKVDIWKLANDRIKEFLMDGMTAYVEIVGFLPNGGAIQKGLKGKAFDYGCVANEFDIYIYRLTYTNPSGQVFEFSFKQVQYWCKQRGLKAVPELYYGTVENIFSEYRKEGHADYYNAEQSYSNNLIHVLRERYLEQDCWMCKNKLPAEGIVIRRETMDLEAYKFKSFRFLEMETKMLDKGEEDIEEEN